MSRELDTARAIAELTPHAFQWGAMDCCYFAGEVVRRVTGRAFMRAFRYVTEEDAQRLIAEAGSLEVLITQTLGTEPVSPSDTDDGDPVLVETGNGPTLGVRYQDRVVFKAPTGLRSRALDELRTLCGWRVQCLS